MSNLAFQLLAAANYIDALGGVSQSYRQALAAHEAAKPEYWEYRPLISHGVWERVTPRILGQTVEELVSELLAYRYKGKQCYEVRALYAAPVAVASPLTADQIEAMPVWKHFIGLMPEHRLEFTRAIEAHHGIKEQA